MNKLSYQIQNFVSCSSGKPGTPNVLVNMEQSNSSMLLLWRKPFENGSAIFTYSVYYTMLVNNVSSNRSFSDIAWVHAANTTNLETQLTNLTVGTRYLFAVTAWNKFGESIKDKNKIKEVYLRSIKGKFSYS